MTPDQLNQETTTLSAVHLIETCFRHRNWSCPRRNDVHDLLCPGRRGVERSAAQHPNAALLCAHVAQRKIRRCRLHLQNYVRGTLAQRSHERAHANASRTRARMKILRAPLSRPRRGTLCVTPRSMRLLGGTREGARILFLVFAYEISESTGQ
jgi:hypothetical protein